MRNLREGEGPPMNVGMINVFASERDSRVYKIEGKWNVNTIATKRRALQR